MNKEQPVNEFDDDLRPEYDFANMSIVIDRVPTSSF